MALRGPELLRMRRITVQGFCLPSTGQWQMFRCPAMSCYAMGTSLGSLRPTGKVVQMRVASHWRLEGDFFVEGWTLVDFDGLGDEMV
mmetsp:Transcript_22932/g.58786  ORF Transcript_22932/g.58786 Transcript_22932/m.58786 type:complete len:87 (+) Transcript_22932:688-948(+)